MLLAATAAEPARGWAGPVAILAAFVAFRLLMPVMRRLRDKINNPSPTLELPTAERVKVKATVGFTEPEPVEPERGWWGEIVERGGHRYRQARQVMATGSHVLPPADDEPDADLEIDLALDEDDDSPAEEVEERTETVEEYITRARRIGAPYSRILRTVVAHYGVSESTAKRRIREVDENLRKNGGR